MITQGMGILLNSKVINVFVRDKLSKALLSKLSSHKMPSNDEHNNGDVMNKQAEKRLEVVESRLKWVLGITLAALVAIIIYLWKSHSDFNDQIQKCRVDGGHGLEAMKTFNGNFAELKASGLFW